MYALLVRFRLNPEHAADFDRLVEQMLPGVADEPGTLIYLSHVDNRAPDERVFYEAYADQSAFEAHEAAPHTQRFLTERAAYLAADPEVWWLTGVDGTVRTAD